MRNVTRKIVALLLAATLFLGSMAGYGSNGYVSTSSLYAKSNSSSQAAFRATMELLALAVEGNEQSASVTLTYNNDLTVSGNNFRATFTLKATNVAVWNISCSSSWATLSKTSGTSSSATITVTAPLSYAGQTITLNATCTGTGRYVTSSYEYLASPSAGYQYLISWKTSNSASGTGGSAHVNLPNSLVPHAGLTIKKVDSSTGDALSGAAFTIQEQVNGTWYDVGTLTEGSTKGTYNQISLTKYYDSSGTAHTYSSAKTNLYRTEYNSGLFRVIETTAPYGHSLRSGWRWCIQVIASGNWNSQSPGVTLGGGTSFDYIIGKGSASSTTAWHYIKSGGTANYANYAAVDDTSNACFVTVEGISYEIANFSTIPFESVAEFREYRQRKSTVSCLRTMADWDIFWFKTDAKSTNVKIRDMDWSILNSCIMGHRAGFWNIPKLDELQGADRDAWINSHNTSSKVWKSNDWKNAGRNSRRANMLPRELLDEKLQELMQG